MLISNQCITIDDYISKIETDYTGKGDEIYTFWLQKMVKASVDPNAKLSTDE